MASGVYQFLLDAGLSEDEIEQLKESKAKQYGGYISEEAALYIVAKDYGLDMDTVVEASQDTYEDLEDEVDYDEFLINISDIKEEMSNIVILGRISRIFGVREFLRKDGTPGIVGSFLVNDGSGTIKVVLWDDQATVMKNDFFQVNELIRVVGCYVKKGLKDFLELHLSRKGWTMLSPKGIDTNKLPEIGQEYYDIGIPTSTKVDISQLKSLEGFFNGQVSGIIANLDLKELEKNGEKLFLLKFTLFGEHECIDVVAWNDCAIHFLRDIDNGHEIILSNFLLRQDQYSQQKVISITKNTLWNTLSQ